MPKVADFIETHREHLLHHFLEEARTLESARGLSPQELLDTLPEYCGLLARCSRQGLDGELERQRRRVEEAHIGNRLRSGYNQEEVTREYALLGQLISSLWEGLPLEAHPPPEDKDLLFTLLQEAMGHVIAAFSGYTLEDRQREKRALRRLDALARDVIGDSETRVPLTQRLEALVEVIQQALGAQGAELLLVDAAGGKLVPAAASGCFAPQGEPVPVAVDSDTFVARVAASEEPVELVDAVSSPRVLPERVRHSGVHSLLGLRLWPHGKLLGVLYVGVTQTRPFEPQAQRYCETLVEYLSGIIQKALLLGQLHEANERLYHSETLHRLALGAISDIIWDWDLRSGALYWSGGVEQLFGFTLSELGHHLSGWTDNIHPEDRERVVQGVHEVLDSGGERWRDEYRFRRRDGSYVVVTDHGLVEREGSGQPVRMVGAMQDVSAARAASEALRVSEERLRLALRAADLGIWDFDPLTDTLRWDERCKAFFGLPPEAEVSFDGTFLRRVHPEDRERVREAVRRSLAGENEGEYDVEYRVEGPDVGAGRWIRSTGRSLLEAGRAVRFLGTVQDISERKRQETEARERAQFGEQLLGIVSHDLRNPLNAILLSATALRRQCGGDERQDKALGRITAAAERATRMIRDLLDFTQARLGGGLPVRRAPMALHKLVRQTLEEVRLAHPGREVALVQSGPDEGAWDADRLAQVVTNLVNNALAYSPEGSHVRVETRGERDGVVLSVHNLGEPISPQLLPRLFEPLTRGALTPDSAGRSIGLGLYIVNRIVHAHGGTVEVRSRAGEGTTFRVWLPRA